MLEKTDGHVLPRRRHIVKPSVVTFADFQDRLPAGVRNKISHRTTAIWHTIYAYVSEVAQTDRFDDGLQRKLHRDLEKWVTEQTLATHLKRMAEAGLLQSHRVVVRYTEMGRAFIGFGRMFNNGGPPAGAFMRYTLPGMSPTLEHTRQPREDADAPTHG